MQKKLARRCYCSWLLIVSISTLLISNCRAQSIGVMQNSVDSGVSAGAFDPRTNEIEPTFASESNGLTNTSPMLSVSAYTFASQGRASAYGGASARSSVSVNPASNRVLGGQLSLSTFGYKRSKPYDPVTGDYYSAWVSSSSSASLSFLHQSQMSDVLRLRWASEGGAMAVEGPGIVANGPSGSYEGGLDSFYPTFSLYLYLQGSGDSSASASLTWSINEALPGLSREIALDPLDETSHVEQEGTLIPNDVLGSWFTSPSAADYGVDETVFFNTVIIDEETPPGTGLTYRTGDALFASDGMAFTTVVMPTAAPNSGFYTLQFGNNQVQLAPGETFDFRGLQAEGVTAFKLHGLGDEIILGNPESLPGYATGLTFTQEGLARFRFQLLSSLGLPGDFNGDGTVDLADYTVWRNNLGARSTRLLNDVDGGLIGEAQYTTWKANFGATLPPSGPLVTTNVPEPSCALLLVAGVFIALQRNRWCVVSLETVRATS